MEKQKKKRIIISVIVIAIIAIIIWQWMKYKAKKKLESELVPDTKPSDNVTAPSSTWTNDEFPLKKWSKGPRVKQAQKAANLGVKYLGMSNSNLIAEDGYYGDKTTTLINGLKAFLKLPVNGQISNSEFDIYIKPLYAASLDSSNTGGTYADFIKILNSY